LAGNDGRGAGDRMKNQARYLEQAMTKPSSGGMNESMGLLKTGNSIGGKGISLFFSQSSLRKDAVSL